MVISQSFALISLQSPYLATSPAVIVWIVCDVWKGFSSSKHCLTAKELFMFQLHLLA